MPILGARSSIAFDLESGVTDDLGISSWIDNYKFSSKDHLINEKISITRSL